VNGIQYNIVCSIRVFDGVCSIRASLILSALVLLRY